MLIKIEIFSDDVSYVEENPWQTIVRKFNTIDDLMEGLTTSVKYQRGNSRGCSTVKVLDEDISIDVGYMEEGCYCVFYLDYFKYLRLEEASKKSFLEQNLIRRKVEIWDKKKVLAERKKEISLRLQQEVAFADFTNVDVRVIDDKVNVSNFVIKQDFVENSSDYEDFIQSITSILNDYYDNMRKVYEIKGRFYLKNKEFFASVYNESWVLQQCI